MAKLFLGKVNYKSVNSKEPDFANISDWSYLNSSILYAKYLPLSLPKTMSF